MRSKVAGVDFNPGEEFHFENFGVWFKYDIFHDFVLAPDRSMREEPSFILPQSFGRLFFLSSGTLKW